MTEPPDVTELIERLRYFGNITYESSLFTDKTICDEAADALLASRQEIERLTAERDRAIADHQFAHVRAEAAEAALRLSAQGREEVVEAYRQALEAARYYIDRLYTAHAGCPVRDLEEAGAAFYHLLGEALALQPKGN